MSTLGVSSPKIGHVNVPAKKIRRKLVTLALPRIGGISKTPKEKCF